MVMGTLYVVATPIGNLGDMSSRALQVLADVDCIAAEDTRHSLSLLRHFGIQGRLLSLHEHNEPDRLDGILNLLSEGRNVALISDAGTPLISDPGFLLVREAHEKGIAVSPVPGASSIMAALSAAGLATDRFVFEGFLPARPAARRQRLETLKTESRTMVFLESCHRLKESLQAMSDCFGHDRPATLAKELTKRFERVYRATLQTLQDWLDEDSARCKGEFVVVVQGAEKQAEKTALDLQKLLATLLEELPRKQAVTMAVKLTGLRKNQVYAMALALSERTEE